MKYYKMKFFGITLFFKEDNNENMFVFNKKYKI